MNGAADPYLARVKSRLSADGFTWKEEVTWHGSTFQAVAGRSRFTPARLGVEDKWFLFDELPEADADSLYEFRSRCVDYALENRLSSLPRWLLRSVTCVGVLLAGSVDPAVAESVRTEYSDPEGRLGLVPFLALYDRSSSALHVYEKSPVWMWMAWRGLRADVRAKLAPAPPDS